MGGGWVEPDLRSAQREPHWSCATQTSLVLISLVSVVFLMLTLLITHATLALLLVFNFLILGFLRKSGEWPDERCLIIRTKDGERDKSVWRSSNVVLFGLIRRSSYAHPPPIQFALTRKTNQAVGME